MKEQFIISGYHITTDPDFQNERCGNTPEIVLQMESIYFQCQDKKDKKIIAKLTELIIGHPKSPQLKNYLSVAYNAQGNFNKAMEVNNWILAEHPDYLFGKLNRAYEFMGNGEPEKVLDILGDAMELKQLYPERDLFHLTEVTGFLKVAICYFVAIENLELAENRLDILKDISAEHPDTISAEEYIKKLRMKKALERFEEEEEYGITPEFGKKVPESNITAPPEFNHSEINDLYIFGLQIPGSKLDAILALPRITLIQDLEKVLEDAVLRFDYFYQQEWKDWNYGSSAFHALFILNEIKAEESLPKLISFLEYEEEFLGFWLGDHLTETLWRCFYGLGFNQIEVLKQLLLKPEIYTYVKTAVTDALSQMLFHHPERRKEIYAVYEEVLLVFLNANKSENLIDSTFLGSIINVAIDCDFKELLPIIKQLFQKRYVDFTYNGDFKEVEAEFNNPLKKIQKWEILAIHDLYDSIVMNWASYNEEDDDGEREYYDNFDRSPLVHQQAVSTKVGRNETCPCGSGKKYKKCCMV